MVMLDLQSSGWRFWGLELSGSKRVAVAGVARCNTEWGGWLALSPWRVLFSPKPPCIISTPLDQSHGGIWLFSFWEAMPRMTLEPLACLESTVPDCLLQRIHTKTGLIGTEFKSMAYIPVPQRDAAALKLRRACCASNFSKISALQHFSVSRASLIFNLSFRTVSILDWSLVWVNYPRLIQTQGHDVSPYSRASVHSVGPWWRRKNFQ